MERPKYPSDSLPLEQPSVSHCFSGRVGRDIVVLVLVLTRKKHSYLSYNYKKCNPEHDVPDGHSRWNVKRHWLF